MGPRTEQVCAWENRARIMLLFLYFMLSRRKKVKQVQLKLTKYTFLNKKLNALLERTRFVKREKRSLNKTVFEEHVLKTLKKL